MLKKCYCLEWKQNKSNILASTVAIAKGCSIPDILGHYWTKSLKWFSSLSSAPLTGKRCEIIPIGEEKLRYKFEQVFNIATSISIKKAYYPCPKRKGEKAQTQRLCFVTLVLFVCSNYCLNVVWMKRPFEKPCLWSWGLLLPCTLKALWASFLSVIVLLC